MMFHPSRLLQVGRSVVLHRLMDREALMLLFDGSESYPLVVGRLGASLITFQGRSRLDNLMGQRGHGYGLRFRPSGVHDLMIPIQRLSFCLQYSLSSVWIFSITITFKSSMEWSGREKCLATGFSILRCLMSDQFKSDGDREDP